MGQRRWQAMTACPGASHCTHPVLIERRKAACLCRPDTRLCAPSLLPLLPSVFPSCHRRTRFKPCTPNELRLARFSDQACCQREEEERERGGRHHQESGKRPVVCVKWCGTGRPADRQGGNLIDWRLIVAVRGMEPEGRIQLVSLTLPPSWSSLLCCLAFAGGVKQ